MFKQPLTHTIHAHDAHTHTKARKIHRTLARQTLNTQHALSTMTKHYTHYTPHSNIRFAIIHVKNIHTLHALLYLHLAHCAHNINMPYRFSKVLKAALLGNPIGPIKRLPLFA